MIDTVVTRPQLSLVPSEFLVFEYDDRDDLP